MGKRGIPALAKWATHMKPSKIQETLSIGEGDQLIKFGLGLPDPRMFPVQGLSKAVGKISTRTSVYQYSPPSTPLKSYIKELMRRRGVECREEQIFLTSGAQQGIGLLVKLLLDTGDSIFADEAIYPGFKQIVDSYKTNIIPIRTDAKSGIDLTQMREWLDKGVRPAFYYSITDGHNPLGTSMSLEKRKELVQLAREYEFPIIEDDPYGLLHYEGNSLSSLRSLDENWVFYVGSFSKILTPSLRVGWVVAPEFLIEKLSIVKEASDINTATWGQHVVTEFVHTEDLEEHIGKLCKEYKLRRDTMVTAISNYFPEGTAYCVPAHGMFTWVTFDQSIDTDKLLLESVKKHVSFLPGSAFSWNGDQFQNCIRLNFSFNSCDVIEDGIQRIGKIINSMHQSNGGAYIGSSK